MKLRPHQQRAIDMCRASMARGNRRIVIGACTSFGKTLTSLEMMRACVVKGKRCVFIADRVKLVEQTLEACDALGIQAGVIQADHWRTDYRMPVQIASAQTLQRRIERYGTKVFDYDLVIHDECHTIYEWQKEIMLKLSNIVWIGLSATPYSKGMGKYYQDLVVPATAEELLEQGYLAPVRYYAGKHINLKGMKSRGMATGGSDFDPKALGEATEKDVSLTGDIVKNWLAHGENRQTIAFTPSIRHSKNLVEKFRECGIGAEHIDGYSDQELRAILYEAHNAGEFKILSCSRLLTVGYDSPSTSCIIDAFPTRSSRIVWVQRVGRGMRTCEGKQDCIYLDHAGNIGRMGPAELIVPESLDDGEKRYNERELVREKREPKVRECPECHQMFVGMRCVCGYEIPMSEQLDTTDEMLEEVKTKKKVNKEWTMAEKERFYGELLFYGNTRGYKAGWASNKYREKLGVWPNKIQPAPAYEVSEATMGWLKHSQIKWARRRETA